MTKKFAVMLSIVVLAGAALIGLQTVAAQGPGGPGGGPGGGPAFGGHGPHSGGPEGPQPFGGRFFERIADKLDLSAQQREQAQAIFEAARTQNEPLREELRTNREALRDASQFGAFFQNEAQIAALAQRQGELHAQMIVSHQRVKAQIYEILTPEQQQQLQQLVQMMEDFGGGHRPRRRP